MLLLLLPLMMMMMMMMMTTTTNYDDDDDDNNNNNNKMPCYRRQDRSMRPVYGCPENFRESLSIRPRLLFPKFLMGVCSDRSYECAHKI